MHWYDGLLGYEALRCADRVNCGFLSDMTGFHFEVEEQTEAVCEKR